MPNLVVAVFFDDDDGTKQKPRVEPGRLVIDSRAKSQSVEFHSFVGQDVVLTLPGKVFAETSVRLVDGVPSVVRLVANPARGGHNYRAHLVDAKKDAEGNSMPKMLVLP